MSGGPSGAAGNNVAHPPTKFNLGEGFFLPIFPKLSKKTKSCHFDQSGEIPWFSVSVILVHVHKFVNIILQKSMESGGNNHCV